MERNKKAALSYIAYVSYWYPRPPGSEWVACSFISFGGYIFIRDAWKESDVEVNNGNYSRTCLFQVMGENNWVIHVTQLCAVSAARELFVKFGKFDSCESFTMAQGPKDKGEKRNASDMEGAPAERAAHGQSKNCSWSSAERQTDCPRFATISRSRWRNRQNSTRDAWRG